MVDYSTFQKNWSKAVGKEAALEFERWKQTSQSTRDLQLHRIESGLSEEDVAQKIPDWTAEDVLAFELSELHNIHFSHLFLYLNAIGMQISIRFREKDATIMDDAAFHTIKIGEIFEKIVKLAGDDPKITEKTVEFLFSYHQQITSLIVQLAASLPQDAVQSFIEKIPMPESSPKANIDIIDPLDSEKYFSQQVFG